MKQLITDLPRQEYINLMNPDNIEDTAALECLGCIHDHLKETGEQITLDGAAEWAEKNFDCMAKAEALSRFNVESIAELKELVHAWWLTGDSVLIRAPRDIEIKLAFAVNLKRSDDGKWCASADDHRTLKRFGADPATAIERLQEHIHHAINTGLQEY